MFEDQVETDVVQLAQRLVCVHAAQSWPSGDYCVNCRRLSPCPLARWGGEVLAAAGWSPADVTRLIGEYQRTGHPVWLAAAAGR